MDDVRQRMIGALMGGGASTPGYWLDPSSAGLLSQPSNVGLLGRADAAYQTSLDHWGQLGKLLFGDPNATVQLPTNDMRSLPIEGLIGGTTELGMLGTGLGTPFAARGALGAAGGKLTQPTTWRTVDGGVVTEPRSAFQHAQDIAEAAGFQLRDASGQSNSLYLRRPGSDVTLRIADHPNVHPGRNSDGIVEARLTRGRDEVDTSWHDPTEGLIEERGYRNVIKETPEQIAEMMRRAIAEYEKY